VPRVNRRLIVPVAVLSLVAAGCGDDDAGTSPAATASSEQGTLTVFADESLTNAFNDIGLAFTSQYVDIVPKFTFGVSDELAQQIADKKPDGVFASSAVADVDKLTGAGVPATKPVAFASNGMTIVVPVGNPKDVKRLEDLTKPDVKVALCVAQSACGEHSAQLLDKAGLKVTPSQEVPNAGAAVDLVASSGADAGIVFVSDVLPNGGAELVPIPAAQNLDVRYVITSISADPTVGQKFIDYVTSESGQSVLAQNNFGPP
jgi:molybdate transport system substrate-binding protein